MAIKRKTAYNMGIKALEKDRRVIAFSANLHIRGGIQATFAVRAAKQYRRFNEAISILEEERDR